ncbi:phosphatidylinositol-specific phospholipase C1-like protein [Nitrospirillum sp. BR 11828]|uniref:phosphatidylinositol-specific phospholipase C1-like protein n=1 Tax=Nitrospirillum sp. BR 11828 TaxID=3104325 RepID=UPI002ACA4343|nr:phosphatidylinositol-specific phospholipase C1-like protein [Nitrospirillum sp. BR 11828]MDZ5645803.1 phosphatidylinositol-specific phospholipase C1-like protein [Nitrospirillum sp. BR 11828]
MMKHTVMAAALAGLAMMAAAQAAPAADEMAGVPDTLKINQIQVLGTHNSYAMPADPRVLALAAPGFERMMSRLQQMPPARRALFEEEHPNGVNIQEALNYDHPDLKTQLDSGVRSLEIDVNPDPKGGTFSDPVAYRMLRAQGVKDLLPFDSTDLDKPGYKVLHIPDVDFRSHCPTLALCLRQIRDWSDAHPRHVPLFIMLEAKVDDASPLPNPTRTVPFDAKLFDDLDAEILSALGRERLIMPDDVRGAYPTLNQAVKAGNWPTLAAARGKILFFMITASGPDGTLAYLDGHPSLKGRVAFLRAQPGEDHAAVLLMDNALVRGEDIRRYVREGYIIRTRSDIETYEAKVNDLGRAKAAFASGAQIVSTDFEHPGNAYGTDYVVRLPGGGPARCNPLLAPGCRPAGN